MDQKYRNGVLALWIGLGWLMGVFCLLAAQWAARNHPDSPATLVMWGVVWGLPAVEVVAGAVALTLLGQREKQKGKPSENERSV